MPDHALFRTSEHEIGLAVDVNARGRATDANWAVYRWLAAKAMFGSGQTLEEYAGVGH